MIIPGLHVVTDDRVLAGSGFRATATALVEAYGPALALHLRSPGNDVRRLMDETDALAGPAREAGALLVVNDRPDVALAGGVAVQLGARSIPVRAARSLLGDAAAIGYSAHGGAEAASAVAGGATFVFIGTIWETPSHPDREGAGLDRVREAAAATAGPVLAIGGVTAERADAARRAGAWGVAVIRGVWDAPDPVVAAAEYLQALNGDAN